MGIQDRDYFHERNRPHAGVSDRRDYSQRLRDMEEAGQIINIDVDSPAKGQQTTPFSIGILLLVSLVFTLGYVAYKLVKAFF